MTEYSQLNPGTRLHFNTGYEYRSIIEIFGWPLLHVTKGHNPLTGKKRVSKGIISIGEVAVGVVAIGGLAIGGFAIGGLGIGVISLGGIAVGIIAAGGFALGALAASGGFAYSLVYATGSLAHAPFVVSPLRVDQELVSLIQRTWTDLNQLLVYTQFAVNEIIFAIDSLFK